MNMDAVGQMFEVNPFSSFSEFFDMEDYIVGHSEYEKFRKRRLNHKKYSEAADFLYYTKVDEIRKELNMFTRQFNVAAHCPTTREQAVKEGCLFFPEINEI